MKKNFLIHTILFFLLMFFIFFTSQSFSFENEPEGFRGIEWGTEIADIDYLVYIFKHPRTNNAKIYVTKEDRPNLGKHTGEKIYFYFWRDKFYSGFILTVGENSFASQRDECLDKYGEATEVRDEKWGTVYVWSGKESKIQLSYDENSTQVHLRIYSQNIIGEINKEGD